MNLATDSGPVDGMWKKDRLQNRGRPVSLRRIARRRRGRLCSDAVQGRLPWAQKMLVFLFFLLITAHCVLIQKILTDAC